MVAIFDAGILNWFQSIQNDGLTALFKGITHLGEAGIIWIVIAIICLIKKETRLVGVTMIVALVFSLIVVNLTIKPLVARPRPSWRNPQVPLLIANPKDFSFPSGHAASSFAAAMAIFMWKKRAGVVAIIFAMIMAATRLYFYVHYPTDVLAGIMFGILFGVLAYYFVKKCNSKEKLRKEKSYGYKL